MHFLLSCDWKLWLKALLQWRWCQVLKIRAFQPWRTATSNCKTHCCNYMLKIEVGGREICPTTYLSPYSCCTQPYVLIPLTLYDFFSLSACKDASMSSSFSLFVLPIALSYVCTHAFLKKKCCIYFVVSFFFSPEVGSCENYHFGINVYTCMPWRTKVACQVLLRSLHFTRRGKSWKLM